MTEIDNQNFLAPRAHISSTRDAEVCWLGILVAQSFVVLAFQLGLGYWSGSLSLIADSGHSTADTITYGINFLVEWFKVAGRLQSDENTSRTSRLKKLDFCGCILTTLMLCASTWFAVQEAVERLRADHEAKDDGDTIGVALLTFAVVSTVLNIITLIAYKKCRGSQKDAVAAPSIVERSQADVMRDKADSSNLSKPPADATGDDVVGVPPVSFERNTRKEKDRGVSLNLARAYSQSASSESSTADCSDSAGAAQIQGSAPARAATWQARLHSVVHPGCGCGGRDDGTVVGQSVEEGGRQNLNVISAMLHLIADVARGLTILTVAILIEARVIVDGRRADSVCALIVAAFVLLGSAELVRRVLTSICLRSVNAA
jgi:Co/Zn/Cd efflux system component